MALLLSLHLVCTFLMIVLRERLASCPLLIDNIADFYCPENAHLAEDYLRFAICKNDDVLELAAERLKGLKKYLDV